MQAVRLAIAVLACSVLGTYRPLSGRPNIASLLVVLGVVMLSVAVINDLDRRLPDRMPWNVLVQALDVVAFVGLAIALDDPLGQQSWALLVVPVVSAAVRYGSLPSALCWVAGCGLYVVAASAGLVRSIDEVTLFARVPGVLLAVAITVGLLARWMREGWEIQNELTDAVATREGRLAVIEQTVHELKGLDNDEANQLCASQTLALGFEAATVDYLNDMRPIFAVGESRLLARTSGIDTQPTGTAIVTSWVENDIVRAHSVAVREPRTNAVITAWSSEPIDRDLTEAFATLVAHTSTAIETTSLLRGLRHSVAHDELTGLPNRRALDQELSRLARLRGRLSVAFVDVDDFKTINDTHGHAIGDKILVVVARRLQSSVGDNGFVARYGGDEFVILLPESSVEAAQAIAEAALASCGTTIAFGPDSVELGLSVGVASGRTPAIASELVRFADTAVYRAKAKGKRNVVALDLDDPTVAPELTQVQAAQDV